MELKQGPADPSARYWTLLIEPVWNWNLSLSHQLEKQLWTFNRTSMELKHWILVARCLWQLGLLIEPVWNWNIWIHLEFYLVDRLLIEPVWNWNWVRISDPSLWSLLLIEPVWNWNLTEIIILFLYVSLLIEPVWNWNCRGCVQLVASRHLLIEPVWNWNACQELQVHQVRQAFNRTSMELKPTY